MSTWQVTVFATHRSGGPLMPLTVTIYHGDDATPDDVLGHVNGAFLMTWPRFRLVAIGRCLCIERGDELVPRPRRIR